MIPIYQDIVGEEGNCLSAVVASIFEVPLREVPHFSKLNIGADGKPNGSWYRHLWEFCVSRGFEVYYQYRMPDEPQDSFWSRAYSVYADRNPHMYHLITGQSPRGYTGGHACVGWNGVIVHDPHPSDHGLVTIDSYGFLLPRRSK